MNKHNQYKEIAIALGWEEIVSKNMYMMSFMKNDVRMNIYFTTGTVQFQNKDNWQKIFRDVETDIQLEEIINQYETITPPTEDSDE